MEMTFYVPPVFLFGNNANRFHNNEKEKSEYKTAAETEIKVENWREKRIAELEQENKNLKDKIATLKMYLSKEENVYCLTKENRDLVEKIEKLLWEKIKLEEENKKLKEKLSEITMVADDEKQSIEHILELEEEIRSLELENRSMKVESEELKMWLRERLPLALLKEYMEKFEGVDLKNV